MTSSLSCTEINYNEVGWVGGNKSPQLIRIPSNLLYYDEESLSSFGGDSSRYLDGNYSLCRVTSTSMTELTEEINSRPYKFMGLVTPDEAMTQLDRYFAVLFHWKNGEDRPLLLGVIFAGKRFLLRVVMQNYPNGDRLWGIRTNRNRIKMAFRSKEALLQHYVMCPQAAVMSYFDT